MQNQRRRSASYIPSTSYIRKFKPLTILCGCTAWLVWGLVGNPEDQFSHNEAHLRQSLVPTGASSVQSDQSYCVLNVQLRTLIALFMQIVKTLIRLVNMSLHLKHIKSLVLSLSRPDGTVLVYHMMQGNTYPIVITPQYFI